MKKQTNTFMPSLEPHQESHFFLKNNCYLSRLLWIAIDGPKLEASQFFLAANVPSWEISEDEVPATLGAWVSHPVPNCINVTEYNESTQTFSIAEGSTPNMDPTRPRINQDRSQLIITTHANYKMC